ncbi:MAG: mgtE, partial [Alphaproteobacteria bacterium]|nr:mgtE [Alphaproteobacteria bacterium]
MLPDEQEAAFLPGLNTGLDTGVGELPPKADILEESDEDEAEENFYGLSDEAFAGIIAAVRAEDWLTVEKEIFDLEPSDIADLLEKATRDDALEMVKHLHSVLDSEAYTYLGYERLKQLFNVLSPREIAVIIADLNTDDAISLLEDFDEDERREILRHVNARSRALVEEGFAFPEDSAGRMMQRDVVAIPQFWTVGKALDYLQALGNSLPQ